ncbi:alanine racemase [Proteobacteria bacterium 005FR1]|nr:alanine racemase [Proteobacteria bacterium 005FR1]
MPSLSSSQELLIDLDALVGNWQLLRATAPDADCAAVVKANAYGLGAAAVTRALQQAGCRSFFVATAAEALALADVVSAESRIYIFNGLRSTEVDDCRAQGFIPILSTLDQAECWWQANRRDQRILACGIQVDTGMNRLGLELREWDLLRKRYGAADLGASLIMSHLACSEEQNNPLNALQLKRFLDIVAAARSWAPGIEASFANSGGVMLGADYHFDQVRPGIALYGGNPETRRPNRFSSVVHLRLPILQLRRVGADGSVGYGALTPVKSGAMLATVQGGYADGLLISQSGQGFGEVAGIRVPMVGRISMDLTVFDVSAVPDAVWENQDRYIEVLNRNLTIDEMAAAAKTISYEVLTRLGQRFGRRYHSEAATSNYDESEYEH